MEASELREQAAPVGASAELTGIDALGIEARSPWQLFWRRFREDKLALGALVFLALLVLMAVFAGPLVKLLGAPGPNTTDSGALDIFGTPTGPSSAHWFGVDQIGRDVFSRTIYGAQVSLIVAFAATALATVAGVIAGLIAGFYRGWVDTAISRAVDVLLAIPYLLLATGFAAACTLSTTGATPGCLGGHVNFTGAPLLIIGGAGLVLGLLLGARFGFERQDIRLLAVLGAILVLLGLVKIPVPTIKPGIGVVIIVIGVTSWTYMARIIRGQVLSLREKEFVEAARSIGASNTRIIFSELLPNLTAPIIVYASVLIPQVILYEAALSFLGVGVQPPRASWGQMISDATLVFPDAWWYMLFPGLALLATVLAFNLVGDAMQDALNPRAKKA